MGTRRRSLSRAFVSEDSDGPDYDTLEKATIAGGGDQLLADPLNRCSIARISAIPKGLDKNPAGG